MTVAEFGPIDARPARASSADADCPKCSELVSSDSLGFDAIWRCSSCNVRYHLGCMCDEILDQLERRPTAGCRCPHCQQDVSGLEVQQIMKRQIKAQNERISRLREYNDALGKDFASQVGDLMLAHEKDSKKIRLQIVELMKEVETQKFRITELERANAGKDGIIAELRVENSALKGEVTALKGHVKELTEQNEMLNETVEELRAENASLKKELAVTKQELVATKKELAATKKELAATKQELAATKQELATTKQELATTRHELAESKTRITALESSQAEMRDQIVNLMSIIKGRLS